MAECKHKWEKIINKCTQTDTKLNRKFMKVIVKCTKCKEIEDWSGWVDTPSDTQDITYM